MTRLSEAREEKHLSEVREELKGNKIKSDLEAFYTSKINSLKADCIKAVESDFFDMAKSKIRQIEEYKSKINQL